MRIFLFYISFIAVSQIATAQLFGPSQLINGEAGIIYEIRAADLDNDGFVDVAIAAYNLISWYKNLDGQGNFSSPIIIQEGLGQAFNFSLADIDDDNKMDIVVSFFDEDKVVWYKNNGNGTFSSMQTIASGLNSARGVVARDLDQDGDLDLVLGVSNGNGLYWVENLDGAGNFSSLNIIDATITQARNQAVEDIDGDGDLDILTNSTGDVYLSWFENVDGQGDFSVQHIIDTTFGLYANSLFLADLDGDGHVDNLSYIGDTIVWRKNLDGLGNFGPNQIINTVSVGGFSGSRPVDIDNDNDLDVLFGSIDVIRVGWNENLNGLGNFGSANTIDTIIPSAKVEPVDLDNDGDLDLVVRSLVANGEKTLVWYENLTILGLNDFDIQYVILYPNPVTTVLSIKNTNYISKVVFYNSVGQKLRTVTNNFEQIDITRMPNGLLFVFIETEFGTLTKKVLKE